MTSWNPGDPPDPSQPPQYGQQPPPPPQYGQQPPPPPQYGQQPPPPPQYGQQPPTQYPQPPQYGQQPPQYGQMPPAQYGAPQYGQPPQYPGGPNPYGMPSGPGQPADVGRRFLAYVVDVIIIGVPFGILFIIFAAAFVSSASCSTDANGFTHCSGASGGAAIALLYVLLVLAAFLYPIVFIGRSGSTFGMRIVGTKVVDATNGSPIGIGRAFIRQILFGICIIVSISSLFDSSGRHQGWHDKAANDIVIATK
jgi:uncharacterized RDD family membrane protein YckC